MSQEVHMDYDNEEECGVNEPHVDCSNAFNTCQVLGTRDNVLQWARTVANENGFVAVIMRLRGKPVHGGEGNTYKTNKYRLPLLDFVGVTPTRMTFSAGFAYLEGERVNNIVWALERFRGLFLRNDRLPVVIVTDRDLSLMNAVKTVFPECTNLLCRFHIDKNVKAKCKSLIDQKNAWDYVMDNWGTLVDCPSEQQFAESLQKFQIACSPWPMNTLNEIVAEVERLRYLDNDPSSCGCVMRSTLGLPCACELSRDIAYPDHNSMCSPPSKVNTEGAPKKSMKRSQRSTKRDPSYWEYVDAFHSIQSSNSSVKRTASSSEPPKPTRIIPMLD
ncbi:Protein FAR1-RELATED SEQUENCE 5 [Glycine soja]